MLNWIPPTKLMFSGASVRFETNSWKYSSIKLYLYKCSEECKITTMMPNYYNLHYQLNSDENPPFWLEQMMRCIAWLQVFTHRQFRESSSDIVRTNRFNF